MAEHAPPRTDTVSRAMGLRIAASLVCAFATSLLGLVQPLFWYLVASAVFPGVFGQEYQLLLPALIATAGVIGGGIAGLLAGAMAPGRLGAAASLAGLGLVHIGVGLYLLSVSHGGEFAIGAMLVPSLVVDFALAGGFLVSGRRAAKSGQG